MGNFVKNPHQFCTMTPRVLEMKKELLEKIEKIRTFAEKSKVNQISGERVSAKLGVITYGVSHLHFLEVEKEMGLDLPVLKLGFFYPLPEKKIKAFLAGCKKVLVIEELEGHIEREVKIIVKDEGLKTEILGKNLLPEIGELNTEKVGMALMKLSGKKFNVKKEEKLDLHKRYPRLCEGCPYWHVFPVIKAIAPDAIFGGDIGCNMIAGIPPHNMHDYLFCMGASAGISHGVAKATGQKVISIMGDGTFFHSGMPAVANAVYNKSKFLIVIVDNRITAMTGHQPNPGMGKTGMGEDTTEVVIEDVVKSLGVKNVKTLDPINRTELEDTVKDFLDKPEVSVIICKRICALLAKRQNNG
jgi:indolepyruvate ferredoxin oxidoreductase alpha subunit